MRKRFIKRILLLFSLVFTFLIVNGQEKVEMADTMRSNGKIYVVVAVLAIILIGLFIFLINIDRKINRLEKQHKS